MRKNSRISAGSSSGSAFSAVAAEPLIEVSGVRSSWPSKPGQPYVGVGPTSWAHTSARLGSEAERSLADEAAGPLAQLLPVPQDGGDPEAAEADDPLRGLRADIKAARGKALLVETTAAGYGEGPSAGLCCKIRLFGDVSV